MYLKYQHAISAPVDQTTFNPIRSRLYEAGWAWRGGGGGGSVILTSKGVITVKILRFYNIENLANQSRKI